jgi:cell division protein FtsB
MLRSIVRSGRFLAQRVLPLAVLLLAVLSVPIMIFSRDGLARLEHLEQEKLRSSEEVSRISAEIRELRTKVQQIQKDPAMVEAVARDELGLVRKTEVVFLFRD